MMDYYPILGKLSDEPMMLFQLDSAEFFNFSNEIRILTRNLEFLSTDKYHTCIEEVNLVERFSRIFLLKEVATYVLFNPRLEDMILTNFLEVACQEIHRSSFSTYFRKMQETMFQFFKNCIIFASQNISTYKVSLLGLVNSICGKNQHLFRSSWNVEPIDQYPFGEKIDPRTYNAYYLPSFAKNCEFDCVKHIREVKIWSRAVYKNHNEHTITFRFLSEDNFQSQSLSNVFVAPLSTFSTDYVWRNQLEEGDIIDYFQFSTGWQKYNIIKVNLKNTSNGEFLKLIDIEPFEKFSERCFQNNISTPTIFKSQNDSALKNISVHSAFVAEFNSHSEANQYEVNDSKDDFYMTLSLENQFAIRRERSITAAKSADFVNYLNILFRNGFSDILLEMIASNDFIFNDWKCEVLILVSNWAETMTHSFSIKDGPNLIKWVRALLDYNIQNGLKTLPKANLEVMINAVSALSNRLYKKTIAYKIVNEVHIKTGIICIKSGFLEKEVFGAKLIQDIENLMKFDNNEEKANLANDLIADRIFEKVIRGHCTLIERSGSIFSILLLEDRLNNVHFEFIWETVIKADSETQTAILKLLFEQTHQFTVNHMKTIVSLIVHSPGEANRDKIDFILALEKRLQDSHENVNELRNIFWIFLQQKQEIRKDIKEEIISQILKRYSAEEYSFLYRIVMANIQSNLNPLRNLKLLLRMDKINLSEKNQQLFLKIFKEVNFIEFCMKKIMEGMFENPNETQIEIAKKIMKFLRQLLYCEKLISGKIIEIAHIQQIFMHAISHNYLPSSLKDFIKTFLLKTIMKEFCEDYQIFFTKALVHFNDDIDDEFVPFFFLLMMQVNEIDKKIVRGREHLNQGEDKSRSSLSEKFLNSNLDSLFGIEKLQQVFRITKKNLIFEKIGNFMSNLFLMPHAKLTQNAPVKKNQLMLEKIAYEFFMSEDLSQVQKGAIIYTKMIKLEESGKNYNIFSISRVRESEKVFIGVFCRTRNYNKKAHLQIKTGANHFQLYEKISKAFEYSLKGMKIEKIGAEVVRQEDYIHPISIYGNELLKEIIISSIEAKQVTSADIFNPVSQEFTPRVSVIVKDVFQQIQENNKLQFPQFYKFYKKFMNSKTCEAEAKKIFGTYIDMNSDSIDLQGFEKYIKSLKRSFNFGIQNILKIFSIYGYDENLNMNKFHRKSYDKSYENDYRELTRVKFANNEELMNRMFQYTESIVNSNSPGMEIEEEAIQPHFDYVSRLFDLLPIPSEIGMKVTSDPITYFNSVSTFTESAVIVSVINALFMKINFYSNLSLLGIMIAKNDSDIFTKNTLTSDFLYSFNKRLFSNVSDETKSEFFFENSLSAMTFSEKILKALCKRATSDYENLLFEALELLKLIEPAKAGKKYKSKIKAIEEDLLNASNEAENNRISNLSRSISSSQKNELITKQDNFLSIGDYILSCMNKALRNRNLPRHLFKKILTSGFISIFCLFKLFPGIINSIIHLDSFQTTCLETMTNPLFGSTFQEYYLFLSSLTQDLEIKIEFLGVLLTALNTGNPNYFWSVLEPALHLLGEIGKIKLQNANMSIYIHNKFDFSKLFQTFKMKLFEHKSIEVIPDMNVDKTLVGYLNFLIKIIKADELVIGSLKIEEKRELIDFIFQKCLFGMDSTIIDLHSVRCQSIESRKFSYRLIFYLLRNDLNATEYFMRENLYNLSIKIPNNQNALIFDADFDFKATDGFAGIKNLGCVCYMIATLQQFFCTPAFRYGILAAEDNEGPNINTWRDHPYDDNILHQLQIMFASLENSLKMSFNPIDFCLSYKDAAGNPIDFLVQQDADEFLRVFFARIESCLRKTHFPKLIDQVFGGKIANVITCKNCNFEKRNEEIFFNLSLEVKNMSEINESFDRFIQPEIISDYMCENCQKKSDVSKKALLQEVPNVLILSLKKMYFDLETLTNEKIHSYYEFPNKMNLKRLTVEEVLGNKNENNKEIGKEKDDSQYEYLLKGVVLHSGSSDHGHYTSLIKSNKLNEEGQEEWFEFDDLKVSVFDMGFFEEDCFGIQQKETKKKKEYVEVDSSKSAYLLFYEKVAVKNKIKLSMATEINEFTPDYLKTIQNPAYLNKVQFENQVSVVHHHFFNKEFANFTSRLFKELSEEMENHLAKKETNTFEISISTLASLSLSSIVSMVNLFFKVFAFCNWEKQNDDFSLYYSNFLKILNEYSNEKDSYIYLGKYNYAIRSQFEELIIKKLKPIVDTFSIFDINQFHQERVDQFLIDYITNTFEYSSLKPSTQHERQFSDMFTNIKEKILIQIRFFCTNIFMENLNARQIDHYQYFYQFLYQLGFENEIIRNIIAGEANILTVVDFYLKTKGNKTTSGKAADSLLGIIGLIYQEKNKLEINDSIKVHIIMKSIKEDNIFKDSTALSTVAKSFCQDNLTISMIFIATCLENITNKSNGPMLYGCINILSVLMLKEDKYQLDRIYAILGVPVLVKREKKFGQKNFGLSELKNLSKMTVNYISTFNQTKGLLQIIFDKYSIGEYQLIVLMSFLIQISLESDLVFKTILKYDTPNYISAHFFDWFPAHINYRDDVKSNKRELEKLTEDENFMVSFRQFLRALEHKLINPKLLGLEKEFDDTKPVFLTGTTPYNESFSSRYHEEVPVSPILRTFRKNLMIGKVHQMKTLSEKVIFQNNIGNLVMTFNQYLVNVKENQPCGNSSKIFSYPYITPLNQIDENNIKDRDRKDFLNKVSKNYEDDYEVIIMDSDKEEKNEGEFYITGNLVFEIVVKNNGRNGYWLNMEIIGNKFTSFEKLSFYFRMPFTQVSSEYSIFSFVLNHERGNMNGIQVRTSVKACNQPYMTEFSTEDFPPFNEAFKA